MENYQEKQQAWVELFDIKVGDEVLVARRTTRAEEHAWRDTWSPIMNETVGKTYKVEQIRENGIRLRNPASWSGGYNYPFYVLVPVEVETASFIQATPDYQGVIKGDHIEINGSKIPLEKIKEIRKALTDYQNQ